MTQSAQFAYVAARLLARHGRRPASADWERLERIGDFGHYLQTARDTGLEPFVRHLASSADPHQVERALRSSFTAYLREVASWQPPPWQPALRWLEALQGLPALAHLAAGHRSRPWMAELPGLDRAVQRAENGRLHWSSANELTPVAADTDPFGVWRSEWRRRLPDRPRAFLPPLSELETTMVAYRRAVAAGEGDPDAALERTLVRLLRRHTRQPVASYAHLGLVALDLQRLRRALLLRRLLPEHAA